MRSEFVCSGCSLVQEGMFDMHIPFSEPETIRSVKLSDEAKQKWTLLTRIDKYAISNKERSRRRLVSAVKDIALKFSLSHETTDRALYLAKRTHDEHLLYTWSFPVIAAAAIYLATREARIILGMDAFALLTEATVPLPCKHKLRHSSTPCGCPRKRVVGAYLKMKRHFGLSISTPSAAELLPIAVSVLGLPEDVGKKAAELLKMIPPQATSKPALSTALAIYAAVRVLEYRKIPYPQSTIAEACGVTDVGMRPYLIKLFPDLHMPNKKGRNSK